MNTEQSQKNLRMLLWMQAISFDFSQKNISDYSIVYLNNTSTINPGGGGQAIRNQHKCYWFRRYINGAATLPCQITEYLDASDPPILSILSINSLVTVNATILLLPY